MHVKWNNIVAALLLLVAMWLFLSHPEAIGQFLRSMTRIGPDGTTEERVTGLLCMAFIGVVLVAIIRLMTSERE